MSEFTKMFKNVLLAMFSATVISLALYFLCSFIAGEFLKAGTNGWVGARILWLLLVMCGLFANQYEPK